MGFTNYITKIKDTQSTPVTHDLVDTSASHYVLGTQTASTNVWTGALPDGVSAYYDGLAIDYFLPYAGTSSGATLNLGGLGAKPVYLGESNSAVTTHYPQYSVIHMTYVTTSGLNSGNGCWKVSAHRNSTYYYTTVYCTTAAGTAAKAGSASWYKLQTGHFAFTLGNANTYAGAITLNINSKGAKPIYINGAASSASNYTLPEGQYIGYYDGTNYYFRTDGKLPGSIDGDAATVGGKTVGINVPSNAVFTDSTVSTLTLASGSTAGTALSHGGKYTLTAGTKTVSFTMPSVGTIPSITLNGSTTTSPSFYAPAGAGTSGQYLKSSGSGAPTWTNFPTIPSITLNGSASTSPSFYAPTGAGTSGQYLKSSGSGAPTWTNFPTIPTMPTYTVSDGLLTIG